MIKPKEVTIGEVSDFRLRGGLHFLSVGNGEKLFLFDDGKLVFEYYVYLQRSYLYNFDLTKEKKRYADSMVRVGCSVVDLLEHLTTEYPPVSEYILFYLLHNGKTP